MPKTKMSICNHDDISHFRIGLQKLLKNQKELLKLIESFNPNVAVVEKSTISFTSREAEIVKLIMDEKTNKEIVVALFISPETIKKCVQNILNKLQVRSRVGIAKYAVLELINKRSRIT